MVVLAIRTPEGVVLERQIAGSGSRFAAGLLDGLLIGLVYLVCILGMTLVLSVDVTGLSGVLWGILALGLPLILIVYHFACHAFGGGQTPGKRMLGLRVLSADGDPATLSQNLLRSVIWMVDVMIPVPVPLGLIVIAATARRQRLGDLVAGTLVVHEGREEERVEPYSKERWSKLERRTLDLHPGTVARLGDEDYEFLRKLLNRRAQLPPDQKRRLFVEAARQYARRLELGAFDDARVVLKELYLFMRESREARA